MQHRSALPSTSSAQQRALPVSYPVLSTYAVLGPAPHVPFSLLAGVDLWHLLSLDAPSVAVVWMVFVGHCAGKPAEPCTVAALFVAVWIVYASDRLLDAQRLNSRWVTGLNRSNAMVDLELRHHFHHRHRNSFRGALVLAIPVLGGLLWKLPRQTLAVEAALALFLTGWLLRVHGPWGNHKTHDPRRLPKEFVVGFFFALAVYLPCAGRVPLTLSLFSGGLLFAVLCTHNCLFLYAWEHSGDLSHAHPATAAAVRNLAPSAGLALFAAGLAWYLARKTMLGQVPLACALSTILLWTLHINRRHLRPLRLRALADVALLTPWVVFLLHRVRWLHIPGSP